MFRTFLDSFYYQRFTNIIKYILQLKSDTFFHLATLNLIGSFTASIKTFANMIKVRIELVLIFTLPRSMRPSQ